MEGEVTAAGGGVIDTKLGGSSGGTFVVVPILEINRGVSSIGAGAGAGVGSIFIGRGSCFGTNCSFSIQVIDSLWPSSAYSAIPYITSSC